ncbi:response regulator transcription factor [Cohnella thailandensis]|uniref:Response regulator n=1 Tax=Cohnella thailandensis TaxID=557557 RepID=A0A841SYI0_9BACL|nr:response regulator [Cohnella thailandensis]MBB6635676.1 response regulator [Cohnella thailandensis]MBP1976053.1 two-component system response regulator YesN [Cohnella thailandensis]
MLTMLVVDDEIYALKGITQGIDWSDLPIGTILEAENVDEAKRCLKEQAVDLVISDIEMPGANGIELLKHIREMSPNTLTIFLTGHARFEYAQEALQNGCFDYVLKPVDHDVLKEIARRGVAEIVRRKEQAKFEDTLESYRRQWASQLPILVERFWQDVLAGRISMTKERLDRELALYGIPLAADQELLPILLSIEHWEMEMDARDESIMEYAVRKAAAEILLGERMQGAVLQDRGDLNLVLLYIGAEDGGLDREELLARCRRYVQACQDYFHCRASCYVGENVPIGGLAAALEKLSQLERANLSESQSVIDIGRRGTEAAAGAGAGAGPTMPSFVEWGLLLDRGEVGELAKELETTMQRFQSEGASREHLELFYFGFAHLLLQASSRKGMSIYDAVTAQELAEGQTVRSWAAMQAWALKLTNKLGAAYPDGGRDTSAIIAKVHSYIQENLHQDLSRDDIAHSVYRNPAYLSRLFRKETGLSLTDYIAQVKIERAKKLLTDTNDKISNIAEGLGYMHFSYFAKLFRKATGLTPQEYRKKHQTI